MNTLQCCVIDDEPLACRLIASYVERTDGLELAGTFTSAEAALERIRGGDIHLAFLDIQMPQMSGMELARMGPPTTRVVFITAYSDYAVEGFRVNALDYLLKPVSYGDFMEAVARARAFHSRPSAAPAAVTEPPAGVLTVKSEYKLVRLPHHEILYVEGLKDYVKIYMSGERHPVLTLMSLKAVEQALPESFMRVHRSFIVNLDYARVVERGRIIIGDAAIPVSDTYKARFMERFNP